MAPIRIGIIGLSSSAATSWASNAHLPYLLSPGGQSKYQIVALCNSSVDAAKRAIAHYKLPAETRAFGSPADIAADPDVQLVVCVTRVDKHYETIKPSIVAGKDVFVEWPLADNIERIRELAALAKEKNVQTTVGLQGRVAPPYLKIKEILESGQIGKVLSSELKAYGGTISRDVIPTGLKYFTERKVGGNPFTIGFGHRTYPYHLQGIAKFPLTVACSLGPDSSYSRGAPEHPSQSSDPEAFGQSSRSRKRQHH